MRSARRLRWRLWRGWVQPCARSGAMVLTGSGSMAARHLFPGNIMIDLSAEPTVQLIDLDFAAPLPLDVAAGSDLRVAELSDDEWLRAHIAALAVSTAGGERTIRSLPSRLAEIAELVRAGEPAVADVRDAQPSRRVAAAGPARAGIQRGRVNARHGETYEDGI